MKTVAITGATGYFGKYLLQKLLSLKRYNLYIITEDITKEINIPSVDVMIHLAAKKPSNNSSADELYKINYEGTKNVAKACSPDTHFIFLSSDYVFKSDSNKIYVEDDVKFPETDYGRSKSKSENFLSMNVDKATILRTSMLYGYINWQRKNFIQFFIQYGTIHACSDAYVDRYQLASLFCDVNGLDKKYLISCESPKSSYWPKHLNLLPSKVFLKNIEISLKNGLVL